MSRDKRKGAVEMAQYEEKFLVINYKRFDELNRVSMRKKSCNCREAGCEHNWFDFLKDVPEASETKALRIALKKFAKAYEEKLQRKLNQKYYVCNQDEPYAKKVIDVILKGEYKKHAR